MIRDDILGGSLLVVAMPLLLVASCYVSDLPVVQKQRWLSRSFDSTSVMVREIEIFGSIWLKAEGANGNMNIHPC